MHIKCVECGRSRLFYRLSEDGLCEHCITEAKEAKQQEEKRKVEEERRLEEERRIEEIRIQVEGKKQQLKEIIDRIESVKISVSAEPVKIILLKDQPNITFSSITSKTSLNNLGNYVVMDVETTGLQPSKCEIIDFAAIRFHNFEPVEKFCTFLSTKKPIPQEAQKINHITNAMVQGMPRFQDIAAAFVDFLGKDSLVGHNLGFDLDFIIRYGADVTVQKRKYYDTLDIARKTVKKQKMKWDREFGCYYPDDSCYGVDNYKLQTLCDWYGIMNLQSHRAEGDALATGMLFSKLVHDKLNL